MLRNLLNLLNPQAQVLLLVVVIILALALGGAALSRCGRGGQVTKQAQEARQQQVSQEAGQAAHGQYRVDSTGLATERAVLLRQAGPRVELPASPPKER